MDPAKYVMILNLTPMSRETGLDDIRQAIGRTSDNAVFVFIHGYNVSFDEGLLRTAQLAFDLDMPGAPVTFSWPSNGSVEGYVADQNDADWAAAHLTELLAATRDELGAEKVHIIAHSMGNRVLVQALEDLQQRGIDIPIASQVVLAAPDIDAELFRRDIYPAINGTTERMTLYASENDWALRASAVIAGGYPRLGDTRDGVTVLDGLETIDASLIDGGERLGHSYFGVTRQGLTDLYFLLKQGLAPGERRLEALLTEDGKQYWRIRRSP
jgi:esterase/lipase superfamily enzyme